MLERKVATGWVRPGLEKPRSNDKVIYNDNLRKAREKEASIADPNKDMQHKLKEMGFDIGKAGVDGKIGNTTKGAIRQFQETFGLPVTGELDQTTRDRITGEYLKGAKINKAVFEHKKDISREFWNQRKDSWIFPVEGEILRNPNDGGRNFGANRDNGRKHAGIDLVVKPGTEVLAMTDGEVIKIEKGFYAGTDAVWIRNSDGSIARYCEIRVDVKEGQKISKGEVIGIVIRNNTKRRSSMLHLEVYDGTANGSLTDRNNKSYKNVPDRNYQRRKDIIDPMGVLELKNEI